MATGGEEKNTTDNIPECSICLEEFRKPKVLPCQHIICEDCLSSFIESICRKNGGVLVSFPCPVCRGTVTPANPLVPPKQWANLMPTNQLIHSATEHEDEKVQNCKPCETVGKSSRSVVWCKECFGPLCKACQDYHRALDVTSSHDLVPLDEVQTGDGSSVIDESQCSQHKEKKLEVFCMEHRAMCCVLCLATQHRKCTDIRTLEDMAEKMKETNDDIDGVVKYLDHLKMIAKSIMREKQDNIALLKQKQDQSLQHIDALADQAKEKIDIFRSKLGHRLKSVCVDKINIVEHKVNFIQRFIKGVDNCYLTLKLTSSRGSKVQNFITTEKTKSQLHCQFEQLKKDISIEKNIDIFIDVDTHFAGVEKALAEPVVVKATKSDPNIILADIDVTKLHPGPRSSYWSKTPVLLFTKCLRTKDEKHETWSCGGSYTANGSMVVTDVGNRKVKLLSESGEIISQFLVDYAVDVCQGDRVDEVFVSTSSSDGKAVGKIFRMRVDSRFQLKQKMETKAGLWGIAKYGSDIAATYPSLVELVDTKQNKSRRWFVSPAQHHIQYLVVSKTTGNVYSTDHDSLMCHNPKGVTLFVYKPDSLVCPAGVALDSEDNVYVCDRKSSTVHQVSGDGNRSRILLSGLVNITRPCGIGFHPDGKRFLITSLGKDEPLAVYSF